MNNDVTIAYRANLYRKLTTIYEKNKENINLLQDFYEDVHTKVNKKYKKFLYSQYLYDIYSSLELLFNDSAIELLTSYPAKISKLQNAIEQLTDSTSLTSAIHFAAEKKINELAYKRFSDYLKEIYSFFGANIDFTDEIIGVLVEGKAVRDLYMHNDGKCNFLYFEKAGKYARNLEDGKLVELSNEYLYKIKNAILCLFDDFLLNCIKKQQADIPSRIFKKMWEMSSLNQRVPFDTQWKLSEGFNGETVIIKHYEHNWSGAEQALFNFFRQIHSDEGYQTENLAIRDISYALKRWRGYPDERLIQSWLEAPFIL